MHEAKKAYIITLARTWCSVLDKTLTWVRGYFPFISSNKCPLSLYQVVKKILQLPKATAKNVSEEPHFADAWLKDAFPCITLNQSSHLHTPGLLRNLQLKNHRWLLGKSRAPRRSTFIQLLEIYSSTLPAVWIQKTPSWSQNYKSKYLRRLLVSFSTFTLCKVKCYFQGVY